MTCIKAHNLDPAKNTGIQIRALQEAYDTSRRPQNLDSGVFRVETACALVYVMRREKTGMTVFEAV